MMFGWWQKPPPVERDYQTGGQASMYADGVGDMLTFLEETANVIRQTDQLEDVDATEEGR